MTELDGRRPDARARSLLSISAWGSRNGIKPRQVGEPEFRPCDRETFDRLGQALIAWYPFHPFLSWTDIVIARSTYAMSGLADVLKISILGNESIHVGFHLLPYIFDQILRTLPSSAYVLVTDTNLSRLYLSDLQQAFDHAAQQAGSKARFLVYEVAPGEGAKSRKVKEEIEDWMLDAKCTRDTVMLAFGGGVIGDLTGFVAATL